MNKFPRCKYKGRIYSSSSNIILKKTRQSVSYQEFRRKKQIKDYQTITPTKKNSNNILIKVRDKKELNAFEYIYKNDKNDVKLIQNLYNVQDCSIFKYGIKESYEKIKYSFCKTCDKNLINPICEACVVKCHNGHRIKQIIEKGNIICSCGKHLHKIKSNNNDQKINCLCYEWSYISKLNFYYNNVNKKCKCYFCHMMCTNNNEKNKLKKLKKKSNIDNDENFQICSCDNDEVHGDVKSFVDYIIKFFGNANQITKNVHPIQIINMIFQSKKTLKYIFFQLEEFINKSKENSKNYFENFFVMDITCTTIYYSFKLIKTFIKKATFAYYCNEVDNYFSFNIYKSLLLSLKKSNVGERSYWIFCRDYTFLFYKLYINKNIRCLNKLKIYDIENLLYIQRIVMFNNKISNENEFKEIAEFLLSQIKNIDIDIYQYNSIESIEYLKNILQIFHKFSLCNLLTIDDMTNISLKIEVIFNFLDLTRKSCFKKNIEELIKIEFKIFSTIMKMMLTFIYSYNDKIIYNILSNKEKYPSVQFVTGEKINFLFKNNKLGDLINKIIIRIISILIKYYKKKQTLEKYEKILLNAIRVLKFSLSTDDNYMKNILRSIKFLKDNNFDISEINNEYYEIFLNESNNIEKYYFDYLNFIISEKELLDLMNKSLDKILGENISNFNIEKDVDMLDAKFTNEKNTAIIRSQLFYGISKVFNILFNEDKSGKISLKKDKQKNNLIRKVLTFYFIFVKSSPDNPLLAFSSCFLTEIIKLPNDYNILIFKLFVECFNIISSNNRQLSNIKHIINILYHYLEQNLIICSKIKLYHYENECLLYYLEIIKIIIYNTKIYPINNSILSYIKTIIINIIKIFDLFKIYFENKKQIVTSFENYNRISKKDINTINKSFIICLKLINDIFDFSSEKEREIINNIIDIKIVTFALFNFFLNLTERTELIRFARKMLIDINYCEEKEDYYTSIIINKKDTLSYIKKNNLISNFDYPTRLLSFVKDFYGLSKLVILKEKIKRKTQKLKNENNLKIIDSNKPDSGTKTLQNNEELPTGSDNEIISSLSKETTFTRMCIKRNFYLGIEKNFRFFRDNSTKKTFSSKTALFNKSFDKVSTKSLGLSYRRKNLPHDKTKTELKKTSIFAKKRSSATFSLDKNYENDNLKSIPSNENENLKYEIDSKTSQNLNSVKYKNNFPGKHICNEKIFKLKQKESILYKNENIYFYPFFDKDFYRIIKFELDNYLYYTNNILLNNEHNIELLKNYFENGLLIPIIYYFKRVFLFIDKYSGEEVIKIYNLIEKGLNLKIYISKLSSKLWSEENENSDFESYNESELTDNDNKNKNKSNINHIYFTDFKYIKGTTQALDELKKNYPCLDYTFLYKIIENEFINMIINNKNLKLIDFFSLKKKEPNIITGDEEYYHSLIVKLIQMEEKKIEDYDNKIDEEKKLIRIYFLFKFNKNYFLETVKELSLFNIFNDICFEFHCNYMSLLLMFIIEDDKENDPDINNIKYYFLNTLLLYMPNEIQSNIIELLGGIDTDELGFIIPFYQKLFKNLILSIIDFYNPSDKIDYSSYFIAYNLIIVFKLLSSQYNSFFQYHLTNSLSLTYSYIIPEKFIIRKTKTDPLNNDINECPSQSSSSSKNSKKFGLFDYFYEDDNPNLNPVKSEIYFFDFFLCVLLKILLISDINEKRYGLLKKQNLFLNDLFHIILDLLIVMIQGNKTITIKNIDNYQNTIIMNKKTESEHHNLFQIYLHQDNYIEIKNSFKIFINRSLEIIFDIKIDTKILLDIKYKLLLLLMSIIEEQNFNKEIQDLIIKTLKINKILIEIGMLLKAYYIYEEEIKDSKTAEENIKVKENFPKLKEKLTIDSKDFRNIDEKNNNKKDIMFDEISNKSKSFERLNGSINFIENSKLPLGKTIIISNDKDDFVKKLNKMHDNEKTNEVNKTTNYNTLNQKILRPLASTVNTQSFFLKSKTKTLLYENLIINPEKKFNQKIKKLLFDDKLCDYFQEKFYKSNNSQGLKNNTLFQLSNLLYRFLKKIAIQEDIKETLKIIKYVKYSMEKEKINKFFDINVNKFTNENIYSNKFEYENKNMALEKINTKILLYKNRGDKTRNDDFNNDNEDDSNRKNFIEQFYIVKFFESITSTVEVRTKEGLDYIAIFTKIPEFRFLSIESKISFLTETNRENGKPIKENILENIDYFIAEINYYKKRKNTLVNLFSKIQFYSLQKFSYYYIFVFNLFLLFTLEGNIQLSDEYSKSIGRYNARKIIDFQNKSLNKWQNFYKYASICYIIINLILIFLWICFRFPLYYKLDKIKYNSEYKIKQTLKLKNKLYIIFFKTFARKRYIFILLYEIIFSTIAVIFNSEIFIVFGLLSIIQFNRTLYNLIKIMKERNKELLLVTLLSIIIIYILSNFSFFFFKKDYEQYIDNYEDNVCNSLLFCFLNAIDYGLRARGGIGDSGKKISFLRHKKHYIGRVFLDDVFFMLIIIIMIDLLFGIITHSFLNIKDEFEQHLDETKRCYICKIKDSTLKKYKIDRINNHKKHIHNIWNYVEYIISLKKNENNFSNYIDTYIIKQIEKKSIAWLPTSSSYIKKYKKEDIEEDNIGFEILEEKKHHKLNY